MITTYAAVTVPINPAGEKPLTAEQVWAGLLEKCRSPHKGFVDVISDCEVLSETHEEIVRLITFSDDAPGPTAGQKVRERITLVEGVRANFYMDNGSVIANLVSRGSAPDELYLTFTFDWAYADIQPGTEEARAQAASDAKNSVIQPVVHSIATMRKMVEEGRL